MTWFDLDGILILSGSHGSLSPIHNFCLKLFLFRDNILLDVTKFHPPRGGGGGETLPSSCLTHPSFKKRGKTINTVCLDSKELRRESWNPGQVGM